ncbi:MAG: GPR endopeptidase [Clostridia bacterium]|nr:GPR endopeptidase [Clostridia bacterium]
MLVRTDLALERREITGYGEIDGVEMEKEETGNVTVTRIKVVNNNGEIAIEKPCGAYVTLEVPPFSNDAELFDGRIDVLAKEIRTMLPENLNGGVLVAGLGNRKITPDALGPEVVSLIFTTRHIQGEIARSVGLSGLNSVCAVATGVLGETGMETFEVVRGLVDSIKPSAVIAVDALASYSVSRLGCTVQISDSGIFPGSGVGNKRCELSCKTLDIPVVSIGVPTVVDAATLVCSLLRAGDDCDKIINTIEPDGKRMMVTPKEIDLITHRAAKYIAMGINCALNPVIPAKDILSLVAD